MKFKLKQFIYFSKALSGTTTICSSPGQLRSLVSAMNTNQGQLSIPFNLKDSDVHHADLFENVDMGGMSHMAYVMSLSEKKFQAENQHDENERRAAMEWRELGQYGAERAVQWEAL